MMKNFNLMTDFINQFFNEINLFDIFFSIILTYNVIQCFLKGFSLSLISFMKWVLSTLITIILVPKFQPLVSEYIQSEFINSVGYWRINVMMRGKMAEGGNGTTAFGKLATWGFAAAQGHAKSHIA